MKTRQWWAIAGSLVGLGLVAPACGGVSDDSATDAVESNAPAMAADGVGSRAADSDSGAVTVSGSKTAQPTAGETATLAVATRELAYTADMTVVAKKVSTAVADAERIVTEQGGFVFGQQSAAGRDREATLTLKVPAKNFRTLLAALAGLGKEQSRSVDTEDVTAQGTDLDARIVSAQKSVDRVRAFLDQTKNVNELSGIEAELTRRETELEQLVGQRRVLNDRVLLATVDLTLTEVPAPVAASSPGDPLRGVPGFGNALATGVDWLVNVARVVGAGLGYSLPFLVLIGVPLAIRRVVRRRRPPVAPAI